MTIANMCATASIVVGVLFTNSLMALDDVAKPGSSSNAAASLVAPEFTGHLDADAAVAAFRADNAEAVLAIGQKLATAERDKGKINTPLSAVDLYRLAIQIAQHNHNVGLLERMEKELPNDKRISSKDSQSLISTITVARKFAAGARKIDAGPGLKASQVSAEAIALYNTFVKEIQLTHEYGTEDELIQLVEGIKQLRELHPKQREHLAQMATTALVAIRDRDDKAGQPFAQLVAVSRSAVSGVRIVGPGEVSADGTALLVVIPTGPASTKPGLLHFIASPGIQIPGQLAWSGTPTVIPVTVKAAAGTSVFVSAGLDSKANSLTWHAQATGQ